MANEDYRDVISPVEDIIEDARNGRMFILVDHEDRENEGDLVIPAQLATPDAINFMATHGRGLICLTLSGEQVERLGVPMMASSNTSRHETPFTVSIEAREGVTTGISAHDRAHTVSVAINPQVRPSEIATPGHVFPLRAREGGVLVRAGHTEAATDIARLAGLNPAGVICEIMKDDGTMARLPDLIEFAQRHGLKIGTISDLIAYRHRHDNLVHETETRQVTSTHGGTWCLRIFTDQTDGGEHVVLTKGDITTPEPVLVRTHALNVLDDVLGIGAKGTDILPRAMEIIAEAGRGAVILFREPDKKLALLDEVSPQTLRQTGIGAQILSALGINELVLLTDNPMPKVIGLDAYDLKITGTHAITKG
ncbi:MAG: 3,4-dihydroxy-2-butanone-4-phosphate synthase [Alphaproteobacteria bacterium]|nr:3,4-dihydroxy-2-butanone-4-phosphate synthase [Alphaproteobacteria bacterium]